MFGLLHRFYTMGAETGLAKDLGNDLERVAVPGHGFLRKGADGKGTSKFTSLGMDYTWG